MFIIFIYLIISLLIALFYSLMFLDEGDWEEYQEGIGISIIWPILTIKFIIIGIIRVLIRY